ncbi:MAG: patatin-like phospholipase family protein [Elusimicrobia bacterium]|nr:patatin-like phospholipase family protein [Elusimicrobiota bacterium]
MFAAGRRLGLVLSGGGSHGAWQAGCLAALREGGLAFESAVGFSIGSITGLSHLLGMEGELAQRWRDMDRLRILRFEPRLHACWLTPVSLYSGGGVRDALGIVPDDPECRRRAKCSLTVVTHRVHDLSLRYYTFAPEGRGPWDGRVGDALKASCAVPWIFPPVRLAGDTGERLHVDGGVPGLRGMRFDALEGCDEVVALCGTRVEELGRPGAWLRRGLDQLGREACLRHVDAGLARLEAGRNPPRVHRLQPSRVLEYAQMDFSSASCGPAVDLGFRDGKAFLESLAGGRTLAAA